MLLLTGSVTAAVAAFVSGGAHAADKLTVDEIIKKAVHSVYSGNEESTYTMKLAGPDGAEAPRKMKVAFRRTGDESGKLMIKFLEPADIRGTALLSIAEKDKNPDQWIYLPALKKVRRIKGGNENEAFLGSDFSVGDISGMDSDQKRYKYEVTTDDKACGSFHCYVITGNPRGDVDAASLPYSKKVLEVRKDSFLATHVELYNADGKLEKVLELKGVHNEGGKGWLADSMEMKNVLTNHSTVIEVSKRDTTKVPSESAFTQAALERM
jgi:hypothetical protein